MPNPGFVGARHTERHEMDFVRRLFGPMCSNYIVFELLPAAIKAGENYNESRISYRI
jgi:hypothetical protein